MKKIYNYFLIAIAFLVFAPLNKVQAQSETTYKNGLGYSKNISTPDDEGIYTYLNKITLITRDDNADSESGKAALMTIHAAKGLEFKVVFLAGCEDAILPHARAIEEDPANIEEERRLFYVAVTRAMKKIYITSCRNRTHIRESTICIPSRFLEEIPAGLIQTGTEHKEESREETVKRVMAQFEKFKAKFK